MKRFLFPAVCLLAYFTPFSAQLGLRNEVSGQGFAAMSQKKRKIKTIVEDVINQGGTVHDALKKARETFAAEIPERSIKEQKRFSKALENLKKILPEGMTLTATFEDETQILQVIEKIQNLKEKNLPNADFQKLEKSYEEEAEKLYPFVPVKAQKKIHVTYLKNGIEVECSGRFRPSSDPRFIFVGPYKIPVASIAKNQRYRFSAEETAKIRKDYIKRKIESKKRDDNSAFLRLLEKHEDELQLHKNDIFYVRRWYSLNEYVRLVYSISMKKKQATKKD